jgi:hypothetical protein
MKAIESASRLIHDDSTRADVAESCFNIARLLQQGNVHFEHTVELCKQSIELEFKQAHPDISVIATRQRLIAAALLEMGRFNDALICLDGEEHSSSKPSNLLRLKIVLRMQPDNTAVAESDASSTPVAKNALIQLVKLESVDFATATAAVRMALQSNLRAMAKTGAEALLEKAAGQAASIEEARILQFEIHSQLPPPAGITMQEASAEAGVVFDAILLEHNSGVCRMKPESVKKIHYHAWNIAVTFARDCQDFSHANEWFQRVLAILPKDEVAAIAQCYRMIAYCAKCVSDWDSVAENAWKSVELEPASPFGLLIAFIAFVHKNRRSEAHNVIKKIVSSMALLKIPGMVEECIAETLKLADFRPELILIAADVFELAILSAPATLMSKSCLSQMVRKVVEILGRYAAVDIKTTASRMSSIAGAFSQLLDAQGLEKVANNNADEVKCVAFTCWNLGVDCTKASQMDNDDSLVLSAAQLFRCCSFLTAHVRSADASCVQLEALVESIFLRLRIAQKRADAGIDFQQLLSDIATAKRHCDAESNFGDAMQTDPPATPREILRARLQIAEVIAFLFANDTLSAEKGVTALNSLPNLTAADYLDIVSAIDSAERLYLNIRACALMYTLVAKAGEILAASGKKEDYVAAVRCMCLIARRKEHVGTECLGIMQSLIPLLENNVLFPQCMNELRVELKWMAAVSHNKASECWRCNEKHFANKWILVAINIRQKMCTEDQGLPTFQNITSLYQIINDVQN